MATIQKYTAQQGLNTPSAPNTTIRSYEGAALQGLGGAISDLASVFQQREETKEDFKAQDGYRTLQLNLADQMEQRAAEMPEDGTGFHKDFMTGVYGPERNKFLASLPPRLRERYETMLGEEGSDTTAWSVKSATRERDQLYNWYDSKLGASKEQLATAISMDPDAYDALLKQGNDEIEASGLPTDQKQKHLRDWERMAQISHLNKMIETRPEEVLRDLGADPRTLTPTTQFEMLRAALIQQESGGRAGAVSPKGAAGLMQVMPGTAKEIAREIGDQMFDQSWNDDQIRAYLSNPTTNQNYGDHYLKKMIRQFAKVGGLEAALVAYNGGPTRAENWIKSGFNDAVLPKETRDYYKAIMKRLPGMGTQHGAAPAADGRSNPANVVFTGKTDGVNKDVTDRIATAFASLGINKVRSNSGFRDPVTNAAAGGAKGSQHQHGNAMDIDVSGYSKAERVKIIEALSAAGITGLGVGANIIHADTGRRRAWGYKKSSGGGEVPGWAKDAINRHLDGSITASPTARQTGAAGRYASLPYSDRQKFIHSADKALTALYTQQSKASAVEKQEMRTAIRNEIASLERSGQSTNLIDDTAVSTILGEDDYMRYIENRDRAMRTFEAKDGIMTMTPDEMEQRLLDYEPEPGSSTFATDQQVHAAVQKEINRATQLRARKPEEAAREFPDVAEAYEAIRDADNPEPAAVQEFVRLTLERQKEFNLKPGSEEPVPRAWAMEIGRTLAKLPELSGRNSADVQTAIMLHYEALEKVFGEYTDDVIIHALSVYKGVGANTGELIGGMMKSIAAGGDPFARVRDRLSQAEDMDAVDGFATGYYDYFGGGRTAERLNSVLSGGDDPYPTEESVDNEAVLRATSAIQSYGEGFDAETEASLRARYGDSVVDTALSRSGRGQ